MTKKRQKVEFRYYEIPENELVLALLGERWIRRYGDGIDYMHFHNYMEVGICHDGEGEILLDDARHVFTVGGIVIIPPNFPHTTNCKADTAAFWEWMYFDIDKVLDEMYSQDSIQAKQMKARIYERPYYVMAKEQPFLNGILKNIIRECIGKGDMYRECIQGLLQLFVIEILRLRDAKERIKRKQLNTVVIAPAIQYVSDHYSEPFTIPDLAAACSISESHFRKVFQQTMNMKPLDYVNLIRIKEACVLLKKQMILWKKLHCKLDL